MKKRKLRREERREEKGRERETGTSREKRDPFSEVVTQTITHSCRINSHSGTYAYQTMSFSVAGNAFLVVASHIGDAQQIFIQYNIKGLTTIKHNLKQFLSISLSFTLLKIKSKLYIILLW